MASSVLNKNKTLKTHIFLGWGMLYVPQERYKNLNAVYKVPSRNKPVVWCALSAWKITGLMFLKKQFWLSC